jgi:hypothetical protein
MKKFFLTALILSFLIPSYLFAKAPTDKEVEDATVAVLFLFGMLYMSYMDDTLPEGVTVDLNMEKGTSSIVFSQFEVDTYIASMSELLESVLEEERPTYAFSSISGLIAVSEENNLTIDVQLSGGSIETLQLETTGEDLASLKANGKSYNHLNNIFEGL